MARTLNRDEVAAIVITCLRSLYPVTQITAETRFDTFIPMTPATLEGLLNSIRRGIQAADGHPINITPDQIAACDSVNRVIDRIQAATQLAAAPGIFYCQNGHSFNPPPPLKCPIDGTSVG